MRVLGLNGWVALLSLIAIGLSSLALYRFSVIENGTPTQGDASPATLAQPKQQVLQSEQQRTATVEPMTEPAGSRPAGLTPSTPNQSYRPAPPEKTVSYRDGQEVVNIGPPIAVDTAIGLKDTASGEVINIGPYLPVDDTNGVADDSSDEVVNIGPNLPVPGG